MKYTINMVSRANTVKGQGVGSAYDEQVGLVKEGLSDRFEVFENKTMLADITHYHTVNFSHFLSIPFAKGAGVTVGYVHFLPETMESSLKLPKIAKKAFYRYLISFYKRISAALAQAVGDFVKDKAGLRRVLLRCDRIQQLGGRITAWIVIEPNLNGMLTWRVDIGESQIAP